MRPSAARVHHVASAQWNAWARSDLGRVRAENQDAWVTLVDPPGPAFAIFDGMGGEARGLQAARAAAAALPDVLRASPRPSEVLPGLNRAVLASGGKTTAAVFLPEAGRLLTVGDSAGYRLEGGLGLRLNPRDRAGRHVVTDCLGDPAMRGHERAVRIADDEALLLCTDGVDDVVGADRLLPLLAAPAARVPAEMEALFAAVDAAGAPDNATVVLVRRPAP